MMSTPSYEKIQEGGQPTQNPPPYSEKPPYNEPLNLPAGPAPPATYGTSPPFPPYYGQPGAGPHQGPIIVQQPGAVLITHVQPTSEPDYLAYSIFTLLCCCLPLGIAALTREANLAGNAEAAKRNSRMARIFAHTALGIGIGLLILYIVLVVSVTTGYN
ncbi:hypothetical protein lerEdw1_009790 [Lerista edwardsae]|nr:hypothetical protein lerEdw1_009790 [Lerista edwardsae]